MKLLLLLSLNFKAARTNKVHTNVREEKVNCLGSQKVKSRERKIFYEFSCKKKLAWMEETIWHLVERQHQINERVP